MDNKEKAIKIKETFTEVYGVNIERDSHIYSACMQMAQWKDEQFEIKLQEIVDYVYPLICGGERLHINEIIGKDMKWEHK